MEFLGFLHRSGQVVNSSHENYAFLARGGRGGRELFLLLFLTGAYTGYVEPEVSVTARAGEAPTPRLGRPLVGKLMPCAGKVIVLSLCCHLTYLAQVDTGQGRGLDLLDTFPMP